MHTVPDLDFDDNLAQDRELFGIKPEPEPAAPVKQRPAQAPAGPPSSMPTDACSAFTSQPSATLADAIRAASDVFGQSNTPWAEEFYKWAQRFLNGEHVDIEQAYGLWARLGKLRMHVGARAHAATRVGSPRGEQLTKRCNAVNAAALALKAVLMTDRGRDPTLWIERCLYRAQCAEGDDRSDGLGIGPRFKAFGDG